MSKINNFYQEFDGKIACYGRQAFDFDTVKQLLNGKIELLEKLPQSQIDNLYGGPDGLEEYRDSAEQLIKKTGDAFFYKEEAKKFFIEKYVNIIGAIDKKLEYKRAVSGVQKNVLEKEYGSYGEGFINAVFDALNISISDNTIKKQGKSEKDLLSRDFIQDYANALVNLVPSAKSNYFVATVDFLDAYPPNNFTYDKFKSGVEKKKDSYPDTQGEGAAVHTVCRLLFEKAGNGLDVRFENLILSLIYYSPATDRIREKFSDFCKETGGLGEHKAQSVYKELFELVENKDFSKGVMDIWAGQAGVSLSLNEPDPVAYIECKFCGMQNKSKIFENGLCRHCKFKYNDTDRFVAAVNKLDELYDYDKNDVDKIKAEYKNILQNFGIEEKYAPLNKFLSKISDLIAGRGKKTKIDDYEDKIIKRLKEWEKTKKEELLGEAQAFSMLMQDENKGHIKTVYYYAYIYWLKNNEGKLISYYKDFKPSDNGYNDDFAANNFEWALDNTYLNGLVKNYLAGHIERVIQNPDKRRELKDLLYLKEIEDSDYGKRYKKFIEDAPGLSPTLAKKIAAELCDEIIEGLSLREVKEGGKDYKEAFEKEVNEFFNLMDSKYGGARGEVEEHEEAIVKLNALLKAISSTGAVNTIKPYKEKCQSSLEFLEKCYEKAEKDFTKYKKKKEEEERRAKEKREEEQRIADEKNANDVIFIIDNIGTVTFYSENKISEAERAYKNLTPCARSKVTNYGTLTNARSDFRKLEEKLAKKQAAGIKKASIFLDIAFYGFFLAIAGLMIAVLFVPHPLFAMFRDWRYALIPAGVAAVGSLIAGAAPLRKRKELSVLVMIINIGIFITVAVFAAKYIIPGKKQKISNDLGSLAELRWLFVIIIPLLMAILSRVFARRGTLPEGVAYAVPLTFGILFIVARFIIGWITLGKELAYTRWLGIWTTLISIVLTVLFIAAWFLAEKKGRYSLPDFDETFLGSSGIAINFFYAIFVSTLFFDTTLKFWPALGHRLLNVIISFGISLIVINPFRKFFSRKEDKK